MMQPIEYRRLGDPMIFRISVTVGLLFLLRNSPGALLVCEPRDPAPNRLKEPFSQRH